MANILVTGGAGYIGSTLVPNLLNEGHNVTVLDNFMYGQTSLNQLCANKNFNVYNGDVRLKHDLFPLLKQADIIIPLAAYVGAPLCNKDPIGATSTNKDAIFMMIDNLSKEQIVIMPTTNSAYGTGTYCTEESALNPISRYAIDKVEVEKRLLDHSNTISYRLATVFGMSPRMRIDLLVNDFVHRAVKDGFTILFEGHFKRNYIHVCDISNAFIHAINKYDSMKNQVYNVGLSEANISKKELCEIIQKYIPTFTFMEAEVGKDPDQRNYIVSNDKIESTGFKTQMSLDAGIQELIKGYRMIRNTVYGNI
jgi:nucleoside-diphosphate-sugar epimerase